MREPRPHQKQFKNSSLGPIPIEWELRKLADYLEGIDAGKSPSCPDRPAVGDEWGILKVSAVRPSGFQALENKAITNLAHINPAFEVRDGDLLITRANTPELVGMTCLVSSSPKRLLLCDKTLRLNVNSTADKRFLFHSSQMSYVRRQIELHATGSSGSMKNIGQRAIGSLLLMAPRRTEQVRIAGVLDTIDDAIRKTEQLIQKLKQMKQGLLHDLLTLGVDENGELRDAERHPEQFRGSSLGHMPKEWKVERVGDLGDVRVGRQRSPHHLHGPNQWPYLRVANVFDGRIDYSDVYSMSFSEQEKSVLGLHPGDILLNEGQTIELVGRAAIYDGEPGAYCFQNSLIRFRSGPRVDARFAIIVFRSWLPRGRFAAVALRTTSVAHLSGERFANMPFAVPSHSEQTRIASVLEASEGRQAAAEAELTKLRLLKAGLMDDLLTGRVRTTAIEGVAA